jgi:hypothetical protein
MLRPAVGYGKPFYVWAGLETEALTTNEFGHLKLGARFSAPFAGLALAWRRVWSYQRSFLPRKATYEVADLQADGSIRYDSLDLSAWFAFPTPGGFGLLEADFFHVLDAPEGVDVFEEYLRVVVRPGWAVATRAGYAITFAEDRGTAGVLGEWLWPGPRPNVARVGPLFGWSFTPHLDAGLILTATIHSPDSIGFINGVFGTARLRYRWATGEPAPTFP